MAEDTTPARTGPIEASDAEPMRQELSKIDTLPVITIPISSLLLDDSPRQGGENDEHTRMLAESEKQLPPIVVHHPSMRVIDGIHRVQAAVKRQEKTIAARKYHGTSDDAFVLSVRMNITHGLPLTRADRTAAAARILQSHPQWSDRMIAATVGLSARTVAKTRARSTGQSIQSNTRLGKDGRARPINHAAGRLRVAALLADNPAWSIHTVAQQAGVSSSTAHDVRRRLRAGQHPTPDHQTARDHPHPDTTNPDRHHATTHHQAAAGPVDIVALFADLDKDCPPETNGNTTTSLLRCMERYRIELPWANKIIRMVPTRWTGSIAQLAREYARVWTHIATHLEQRVALTTLPPRRHQPLTTRHPKTLTPP